MLIRKMEKSDISGAAEVHRVSFTRQRLSFDWIESNYNAFPRILCYVAETSRQEIIGYIIWCQKSGFRPEVVLELDQLAVSPAERKNGVGRALIEESLSNVNIELAKQDSILKHVIVTTRADNGAQELYKKTLGAEVEAVISSLYSADEVLMIARTLPSEIRLRDGNAVCIKHQ